MIVDYPGFVLNVHDGDTAEVRFIVRNQLSTKLTIITEMTEQVRLDGINAPELPTVEGKASRDWLLGRLAEVTMAIMLRIDLEKRDKYGRALGRLIANGVDLNSEMIVAGFAKPYTGRGPK